jgi:hypothetical protein
MENVPLFFKNTVFRIDWTSIPIPILDERLDAAKNELKITLEIPHAKIVSLQ